MRSNDGATREAEALLLEWAQGVDHALVLTDMELRPEWMNESARRLLRERGALEVRNGVLTATGADEHAHFLARINASLADGGGSIVLGSERDHLVVTLKCLQGNGSGRKLVFAFWNARQAKYPDLRRPFGLTAAEAEVLRAMLQGEQADQVARRKGVSVDTVRSQVRAIYAKLEVTSREALFQRAAAFVIVP